MDVEKRKQYLHLLLIDAMRARSILFESMGDDEVTKTVLAGIDPWLFDEEKCIVPILAKLQDKEPTDGDIVNFSYIARNSPNLQVQAAVSGRVDPEPKDILLG